MLTGGCLCGSLRYEIDGEAATIGKCYCEDCRRETGTGHITFLSVPAGAVRITGTTSEYRSAGGSGSEVVRVFCPSCGSTILGYPRVFGDIAAIRVGTLDDSSALSPTFAVFGASAPAWDRPPEGIRVFESQPKPR